MRTLAMRFGAAALLAAGLLGCKRDKGAPSAPPPPDVSVIKPAVVPVQAAHEYNGHLNTTHNVEVRARVKGILKSIRFKDGQEVRGKRGGGFLTVPGQLLYTIDDREFQTAVKKAEADLAKAEADIDNWKAQIDLAKAELRRAERAAANSATAQTDVDKARATLGVNTAQLAAAVAARDSFASALHSAHIPLSYTKIHAEIDGRMSQTMVRTGNLVGQTEPTLLTTIVRMDELFVEFDVPERDWVLWGNRVAYANSQAIPIEIGTVVAPGYPYKGRIDFVDNRVDVGTGTVHVRGRVMNPKNADGTRNLYPGLYTRVRVPASAAKDTPVIPEDALMTGQEGRYVYVVDKENKVAKRAVELGPQVYRAPPPVEKKPPEWVLNNPKPAEAPEPGLPPRPATVPVKSVVAIIKGLSADDVVIVDGLQKAKPGAEVKPEEWRFIKK